MTPRLAGRLPSLLIAFFLVLLVLAGRPGDACAEGAWSRAPVPASAVALPAPAADADSGDDSGAVVEQLRVKVAAAEREAWLQAEQQSWGPWLQRQEGFLGRELLWDGERQEGLLLIRWRSRGDWLAIPASEMEAVQERFERAARLALSQAAGDAEPAAAGNPFPLVAAGELEPLGLTAAAGVGVGVGARA